MAAVDRRDVSQALIAFGGTGSRLRGAGINVPGSKGLFLIEGKPMLHWSIDGLRRAGISRYVIASETPELLRIAGKTVEDAASGNNGIKEVVLFQDKGEGVTRLPIQVRDLLDERFLYEQSNHITVPDHVWRMNQMAVEGGVVYTAYSVASNTKRPIFPVDISTGVIYPYNSTSRATGVFAIEGPFILDQEYVANLPGSPTPPDYKYCISIINSYAKRGLAAAVYSTMPVEIDTAEEFQRALPIYQSYISDGMNYRDSIMAMAY